MCQGPLHEGLDFGHGDDRRCHTLDSPTVGIRALKCRPRGRKREHEGDDDGEVMVVGSLCGVERESMNIDDQRQTPWFAVFPLNHCSDPTPVPTRLLKNPQLQVHAD